MTTKDERFLIELYRAVLSSHDPEGSVNPIPIAKRLGYKENLTKNILKGLRQANLIVIYGPEEVLLTSRGVDVAHSLIG
jgi:Mn-dependent DtxR family transcriptional regulator